MAGVVEEAHRITTGLLDPTAKLLNGLFHRAVVGVSALHNIKANVAQCPGQEPGIIDGVVQALHALVGVIPNHQCQPIFRHGRYESERQLQHPHGDAYSPVVSNCSHRILPELTCPLRAPSTLREIGS
jgi:hypothetical protein